MADAEATTTETTQTPPVDTPALPADFKDQDHSRADVEILYKIYVDKRLNSQADFYKSRVRENQSNANFTFLVSTAVMSISALVAAVSAVISSPFFSLLSAILPALAALLAAFRQLYGWERQSSIYQDALMGLERVKLLTPDKDEMASTDLASIYPHLVAGGEQVFTGEVNQWGQFVQNADKTSESDSTDSKVTDALMSDLRLSDEQIDTIRKIVAAGMPKAAFSDQTITVHPEETSALPSGASMTPDAAQSAPSADVTHAPTPITVTTKRTGTTTIVQPEAVLPIDNSVPSAETGDTAQAAPANKTATTETEPIKVTTTRVETMTIHPPENMNAFPVEDNAGLSAQAASDAASTPIAVTTTRVDTTVVEHHILASDLSATESLIDAPAADGEPPAQEEMSALSPGSMHVETPQVSEETDAMASHQEFVNEPPPPEALSSLAPGAMHVDAPQAPSENPDAPPPSTDNG